MRATDIGEREYFGRASRDAADVSRPAPGSTGGNERVGMSAADLVFGVFAVVVGILSIILAFRVRDFGTQIGAVT